MEEDVTRILESLARGDSSAADKLLPLVYEQLRRLAASRMASERSGHTLQATALVHEAWIKLSGPRDDATPWNGSRHFFAAAAEAMRRILVDHARRRKATRRGGNWKRVTLGEPSAPSMADPDEIIDLNAAMEKFERVNPDKAALAKLRLFAGLTIEETGEQLGLSKATVKRHWSYAKAWLSRELRHIEPEETNG